MNKLIYCGNSEKPCSAPKNLPWVLHSDGKIYLGDDHSNDLFHLTLVPPIAVGYMKLLNGRITYVDEKSSFYRTGTRMFYLKEILRQFGITELDICNEQTQIKLNSQKGDNHQILNSSVNDTIKTVTTPSSIDIANNSPKAHPATPPSVINRVTPSAPAPKTKDCCVIV